jgi:hypothetical protein
MHQHVLIDNGILVIFLKNVIGYELQNHGSIHVHCIILWVSEDDLQRNVFLKNALFMLYFMK